MNILLAYNDTERLEPRARACRAARQALRGAARRDERHAGRRRSCARHEPWARAPTRGRAVTRAGIEAELVEAIGEIASAVVEVAETHDAGSDRHRDARAEPSRADARALRVGAACSEWPTATCSSSIERLTGRSRPSRASRTARPSRRPRRCRSRRPRASSRGRASSSCRRRARRSSRRPCTAAGRERSP